MPLPARLFTVSLTTALVVAAGTVPAVAAAAPQAATAQAGQSRSGHRQEAPPKQAEPKVRQRNERARPPRQQQRRHGDDPLSDSIRRIERRTRGQILSAERVPYDGRSVSRIKVVDEFGRVRVYVDDPQESAEPRTHRDDD